MLKVHFLNFLALRISYILLKMSSENGTFNGSDSSVTVFNHVISNTVKFWIYLIFLIPSIICSLFFLYHVLCKQILRNALHNRVITVVIIIGLIYQLTIYPWMLYYYHYVGIWNRSPIFCTIWSFIDGPLYFTQTILFAWATMERHILIFHDRWVSTRRKRFFIHYLPPIILLTYCLIFYVMVTVFPSCKNSFDDSYMICVTFCFTQTYALYIWDALVHQALPNLVIVVFSVALLVRVLRQKHHVHQPIQWRKHRKMTVQLLSISILYLIFAFPLALMNLMYLCGLPGDVGVKFNAYLLFFNYLMLLLLPLACVLSLPKRRSKMTILKLRLQRRTVAPTT
jgi:heme exporter protein D